VSYLEPNGTVAPALLLHRIEIELAGCRTILTRVENAVETLLKSGNIAQDDPLHIVEMQSIDLLDQSLADLMLLLQDLADTDVIATAQPVRMGPVMQRIRLAAMRSRLTGLAYLPDDTDGVELF
jgi:hypothetical protein